MPDQRKDEPAQIEGEKNDRPNDGASRTAVDERGTKNIRGREDLSQNGD